MRSTFRDPAHQEQFERDGYVVIPMLDADEVAELRRRFEALGSAPGDPQLACHSSFHTYDRDYKRNVHRAVSEVLAPHVEQHLDRQRMLPSNFIVKWPSGMSGFGLHQDLTLVDEAEHRSAEVWVALDDTNERNGQLWMVPGSHRWIPTMRGINAFPFPFGATAERIIERHARPVPVQAGDAVIFNHAILHFSQPNRSDAPRMVAITDVIPAEAEHIHLFGDGTGPVAKYVIDDSFWTDNSPFTLWKPPAASQLAGMVDFEPVELTDEDLDRLVAEGLAHETGHRPRGALNAGRAWCHRCGTTEMDQPAPHRLHGNVTMLCDACRDAEATRAETPAHAGI